MKARHSIRLLFTFVAVSMSLLPGMAYADGVDTIFSDILSSFLDNLNAVKDALLPQIYAYMTDIVQAAGTLYITFYGMEILAGSNINAREALGRMAKVAIITALATGGGVVDMDTVYRFCMSLALDVSGAIIQQLAPASWLSGMGDLQGSDPNALKSVFSGLDGIIGGVINDQKFMGMDIVKLAGITAVLMGCVPQLGGAMLQIASELFQLLANALVGVLLAVATITFLVSLGPLFVAFYFFQITEHLFTTWWRSLASYSLQILFVFASMALWSNSISQYSDFIDKLDQAVAPFKINMMTSAGILTPVDNWGICNGSGKGKDYTASGCSAAEIAPANIANEGKDFVGFLFYYLTSLLCLTYGFSALMKSAPSIAQQITGAGGSIGDAGGTGMGNYFNRRDVNTTIRDQEKNADNSTNTGSSIAQASQDSGLVNTLRQQIASLTNVRSGPPSTN